MDHGQLTKIKLSEGDGGESVSTAANVAIIAMDLEAIWENST